MGVAVSALIDDVHGMAHALIGDLADLSPRRQRLLDEHVALTCRTGTAMFSPECTMLLEMAQRNDARIDAATKELRAEAVREIEAFIGRLTTRTAEPAKAGAQ